MHVHCILSLYPFLPSVLYSHPTLPPQVTSHISPGFLPPPASFHCLSSPVALDLTLSHVSGWESPSLFSKGHRKCSHVLLPFKTHTDTQLEYNSAASTQGHNQKKEENSLNSFLQQHPATSCSITPKLVFRQDRKVWKGLQEFWQRYSDEEYEPSWYHHFSFLFSFHFYFKQLILWVCMGVFSTHVHALYVLARPLCLLWVCIWVFWILDSPLFPLFHFCSVGISYFQAAGCSILPLVCFLAWSLGWQGTLQLLAAFHFPAFLPFQGNLQFRWVQGREVRQHLIPSQTAGECMAVLNPTSGAFMQRRTQILTYRF